jgi:hypothetical protein
MINFNRAVRTATAVALLTLVPDLAASAQPNEPADAQEQAEGQAAAAEYENAPGHVPYNPDPRLSDKAASVQQLYNYWLAAESAVPCNFPHYNSYMPRRIFEKVYSTVGALLPDGRDDSVAYNHLLRHEESRLRNSSDCPMLKVRLQQFKAATGFPPEW